MPRRIYVIFALGVAVVAVSFFVAETFVPDVGLTPASPSAPADTSQAIAAPATTPGAASGGVPGGVPAWIVLGSLGVAAMSLGVAGGALWTSFASDEGTAPARDRVGVEQAQVDAVVDLARALVPCLHAATQYVQMAQMLAQLGDDAPADLADRVDDARTTVEAQHRDVHAAVTQGAVFLPNAVLDAVHDVDRVLRTMLSDGAQVRQQGTSLVAQAMTAYYTFAATARQWAGVGELQVERLLGLSPAPGASSSNPSSSGASASGSAPATPASDDPSDPEADEDAADGPGA